MEKSGASDSTGGNINGAAALENRAGSSSKS